MEDSQTTMTPTDQQRTRISKFLSVPVEDLSRLLEQLHDGSQTPLALQQLIQHLDEKAVQEPAESWKEQAEEAKAALSTEKINFGKLGLLDKITHDLRKGGQCFTLRIEQSVDFDLTIQ
jgi:hypothetical protein